ncbi:MAG: lytic transglycosylase domain-containing protein [Paracoccaceae bacterium]
MRLTPSAALALALSLPVSPLLGQQSAPPPRAAGAIGALVDAVARGDVEAVHGMREAAGPLGVRIATWRVLRDGVAGDFATYAAFSDAHRDWPGMALLDRRAEGRMQGQPAAAILAWFASRSPQTAAGALALAQAQAASGADPAATLESLWLDLDLTEAEEAEALARFGPTLAPLHARRLDALLWRGAREQADRILPRVPAAQAALARARLALQRRQDGVNALIAALPASVADDPGLAYDRFRWRLANDLDDSAAELMRERSPDRLGRPGHWAGQRARLTRAAIASGNAALAYDLASRHGLNDAGTEQADLEWLAGYVALRFLNRPDQAARHFAALRNRSVSPITLGRAGYWEGRAHEAAGRTAEARASYEFGARHQTAFYGQLAAERLGLGLDPALLARPEYPDWHTQPFARSDVFRAADLLYRAGQWYEARRFTLHLAESLTTEAELGSLARMWLERGEPHFALRIAKQAAQIGIILPDAYFPLSGLERQRLAVAPDLALAIARRESEFDHRVTSHADARGLMQVLPSTGRHTAGRLGIEFDEGRLTSDPDYNAILGAGYLDELAGLFDGTLSLVTAGYNAGPGRPRRWITENGDPRDPGTDPIDWVEAIPFTETRNYVMRVTESVVIYRAILSGRPAPIRLTDILRGRD